MLKHRTPITCKRYLLRLGRLEDEPPLEDLPELLGAEPPPDEPPPEGLDTLPPEPAEPFGLEPDLGLL